MAFLGSEPSGNHALKVAGTRSRKAEFQAALGLVRGTRRVGTAEYRMSWLAIQETMLPTLLCLGVILIGLIA
jgi:hypothetical protein